jgi:ubiquitin-like modifier-activating enzyme ATG7
VDNGQVSFSNPVRQPLYQFQDAMSGGAPKAETAANNLKLIQPTIVSIHIVYP